MSTTQTQTALARLTATTLQTQGAKANLGIPTSKTQPAKARLTGTGTQTQGAKGRLTGTATKTQTALARLEATGTQTQAGKARLTGTGTQTQGAKGRVTAPGAQTQGAKAYLGPANFAIRSPATPGLSVTYGSVALNETNGIVITSDYDAHDTSIFGAFYCEFRVRMDSVQGQDPDAVDQTFAALITRLETSLRIPRQELLVKFGTRTVRDWNFNQSAQTAFLIMPELTLIRENRRDFTYGFRVRCQFPGNIPSNAFRRESNTSRGDSISARRTCVISATWTSSPGLTASTNYTNGGDTFFDAYLPANRADQYGTSGTWIRADESPVSTNDENSLCTATRMYWEVYAGRRESQSKAITTIGDRRVFTCPSTWTTTSTANALQNYLDGGDTFYLNALPAPIAPNASWVLVDEEPSYNDLDGPKRANHGGILVVLRTYHEVIKGLREFRTQVTTNANQLRDVTVSGTYYATASTSAYTNFSNGITQLIADELAAITPRVTQYESLSVPKIEGHDTTGKRYSFAWTMREIAFPQGPGGNPDNPDITINTLTIETNIPLDPQSLVEGVTLDRLRGAICRFSAVVNYKKNQDPASIWTNGGRDFVVSALQTKLGTGAVEVVNEQIGVGLHDNTLIGTLWLIVVNSSILSMKITQTLIQVPGRDFAPRADGTAFSYYPYRAPPEKILKRDCIYEYVVGGTPPANPFASPVSGFGLIDTGSLAQANVDAQNSNGVLSGTGWYIDRRAGTPFLQADVPTTRGLGFETVIHAQTETWRYIGALEAGVSIP